MNEDLEVLSQHVDCLGLKGKEKITQDDLQSLYEALLESDETVLAEYVESLGSPEALHDLIVNTLCEE